MLIKQLNIWLKDSTTINENIEEKRETTKSEIFEALHHNDYFREAFYIRMGSKFEKINMEYRIMETAILKFVHLLNMRSKCSR